MAAPGIVTRHQRRCRSCDGGRCNCSPTFEAWVYCKRNRKKVYRRFSDRSEAKS